MTLALNSDAAAQEAKSQAEMPETASPVDVFDRAIARLLKQTVDGDLSADDGYQQLGLLVLPELGPLVRKLSRGATFTADDLWQAFMVRLFKYRVRILRGLVSGVSARAFFIRMLQNAAADLHNESKRCTARRDYPRGGLERLHLASDDHPEKAVIHAANLERLSRVMQDLHADDRALLAVAYTDRPRHVAAELGIETRELQRKLHGALRRLRASWVERYGGRF